jgi:hypothetical protein
VPNTKLIYFLYLMPLFMTTVSLIAPIQIQGQPITDNTTGERHMMPPSMPEDKCYDPNSPVGPSADDDPSCKNKSTSNTTDVKCMGASDDPVNCRMDTVCIGGPDEPLNCREVPFVPSGAN